MVGGDAGGLCHVALEVLLVIGDDHATATQDVARAHEERVADAGCDRAGFVKRFGDARNRIRYAELVEQRREPVAVLGKVDGGRLRAHDVHALIGKCSRELERRLPAKGHDDAIGCLRIDDIHDVLVGNGLEVEAVGGVVVGRNRLGIAVHHDCLVSERLECIACLDAAVIELDALTDAIGTGRR